MLWFCMGDIPVKHCAQIVQIVQFKNGVTRKIKKCKKHPLSFQRGFWIERRTYPKLCYTNRNHSTLPPEWPPWSVIQLFHTHVQPLVIKHVLESVISVHGNCLIVHPSNINPGSGGVGIDGKVMVPPYSQDCALLGTVNCVSPLYQIIGTVFAVHWAEKVLFSL